MHKILSVLFVLTLTTQADCTWLDKNAKTAGAALIDCAKGDVASVVAKILADVASTVSAGGSGWESDLDAIGKTAGSEALACAVKAVSTVLAPEATGSAKSTAELSPAAQRAELAIASHGWAFKH